MATQRTIAIIGACSNNGKLASKKLAIQKSRLLLLDEDTESLLMLKKEIEEDRADADIEIMECFKEAGWEADIIVLASDWQAEKEIITTIKPFITGKTVVSFTIDNNCLLPYSKVIALKEENIDWPDEMEAMLKNSF